MTIPANVLIKAKNGNKEAKEIVCNWSLLQVKRMLLKRGVEPEELDDLAQNTMIRIVKGLPDLKHNAALVSFLLQCTHSAWIDYLRKKTRMKKVIYMPVEQLTKYFIEDADPNTLRTLELMLAESLSAMPIHLQRLFFLWKIQDLNSQEIAGVFDRSPKHIKRWKAELLRRLQRDLFLGQ